MPRLSLSAAAALPLLACAPELPEGAIGMVERSDESHIVVTMANEPACDGRSMQTMAIGNGSLIEVGFSPAEDMVVNNHSNLPGQLGDDHELNVVYLYDVEGDLEPHLVGFNQAVTEGDVEFGDELLPDFRSALDAAINDQSAGKISCY